MKNLRNSDFIAKLKAQNTQHIELAKELAELGATELNQKMNSSMWSANECIEHLNRYFDYYLPEIKQRIENSRTEKSTLKFKSGWLGNYFAESMLIKNGKKKPIKTFKDKDPISKGSIRVNNLSVLINNLEELDKQLSKSEPINLAKTKTLISISKFIKLRLGDTFRFVINHNERHIRQAFTAAEIMSKLNSNSLNKTLI